MKGGVCVAPARRFLLSLVAPRSARALHQKSPPEESDAKPLPFSSSKASHRRWSVAQSLGSDHQQPWWKVLPICVTLSAILLWAAFRKETEIDEKLYRPISHLTGEAESDPSK